MQYWINHNGVQSGPVDVDGLKELALTSRAYVWHEGMTNWVKITDLPELQGLYEVVAEDVEVPTPQTTPVKEVEPSPQPMADSQPMAQGYPVNQPVGQPWQQPYQAAPQPAGAPAQPARKCPPTNLVWAILSTICCCLPAGIVAIIYSVKVTNKFNMGDFEGAERASETSAWWCIASIVLGIISMPLAYLMPLLSQ